MKQFKKAVSFIAVLAFLITALIPVSGLAATGDVTIAPTTGIAVQAQAGGRGVEITATVEGSGGTDTTTEGAWSVTAPGASEPMTATEVQTAFGIASLIPAAADRKVTVNPVAATEPGTYTFTYTAGDKSASILVIVTSAAVTADNVVAIEPSAITTTPGATSVLTAYTVDAQNALAAVTDGNGNWSATGPATVGDDGTITAPGSAADLTELFGVTSTIISSTKPGALTIKPAATITPGVYVFTCAGEGGKGSATARVTVDPITVADATTIGIPTGADENTPAEEVYNWAGAPIKVSLPRGADASEYTYTLNSAATANPSDSWPTTAGSETVSVGATGQEYLTIERNVSGAKTYTVLHYNGVTVKANPTVAAVDPDGEGPGTAPNLSELVYGQPDVQLQCTPTYQVYVQGTLTDIAEPEFAENNGPQFEWSAKYGTNAAIKLTPNDTNPDIQTVVTANTIKTGDVEANTVIATAIGAVTAGPDAGLSCTYKCTVKPPEGATDATQASGVGSADTDVKILKPTLTITGSGTMTATAATTAQDVANFATLTQTPTELPVGTELRAVATTNSDTNPVATVTYTPAAQGSGAKLQLAFTAEELAKWPAASNELTYKVGIWATTPTEAALVEAATPTITVSKPAVSLEITPDAQPPGATTKTVQVEAGLASNTPVNVGTVVGIPNTATYFIVDNVASPTLTNPLNITAAATAGTLQVGIPRGLTQEQIDGAFGTEATGPKAFYIVAKDGENYSTANTLAASTPNTITFVPKPEPTQVSFYQGASGETAIANNTLSLTTAAAATTITAKVNATTDAPASCTWTVLKNGSAVAANTILAAEGANPATINAAPADGIYTLTYTATHNGVEYEGSLTVNVTDAAAEAVSFYQDDSTTAIPNTGLALTTTSAATNVTAKANATTKAPAGTWIALAEDGTNVTGMLLATTPDPTNSASVQIKANPTAGTYTLSYSGTDSNSSTKYAGMLTVKVTAAVTPPVTSQKLTFAAPTTFVGADDTTASVTATVTGLDNGAKVYLTLTPDGGSALSPIEGTVQNGKVTFSGIPVTGVTAENALVYNITAENADHEAVACEPASLTFARESSDGLNLVDGETGAPIADNTIKLTAGGNTESGEGAVTGTREINVLLNDGDEAPGVWEAKPTTVEAVFGTPKRISVQRDGSRLTITVPLGVAPGIYQIIFTAEGPERAAERKVLTLEVNSVLPATTWISNGQISGTLTAYVVNNGNVEHAPTGGNWSCVDPGSGLTFNSPTNYETTVTTSSSVSEATTFNIAYTVAPYGAIPARVLVAPTGAPAAGSTVGLDWADDTLTDVLYSSTSRVPFTVDWNEDVANPPSNVEWSLTSSDQTVIADTTLSGPSFTLRPAGRGTAVICVQASDGTNTYRTEPLTVTFHELTVTASGATAPATLNASVLPSLAGVTYQWFRGASTQVLGTSNTCAANEAGTYRCVAGIAGTTQQAQVSVTVNAAPTPPPADLGNTMAWALQIADDSSITEAEYASAEAANANMSSGKMPTADNLAGQSGAQLWHQIADTGADTVATTITVPENARFALYVPLTVLGYAQTGAVQSGRNGFVEWEYKTSGTQGNQAGGDVITIADGQGFYGVQNTILTSGPVTAAMDGYEYRMVYHVDGEEVARSPWIAIKVDGADKTVEVPQVIISSSPAATTGTVDVTETGSVTFTADVQHGLASASLAYQWQSQPAPTAAVPTPAWTDIPGETKSTYTIPSVGTAQNGLSYRCVVSNNSFSGIQGTSNVLTLAVNSNAGAVVIKTPVAPAILNRYTGKTASFAVDATTNNGDDVTYQWYMRASIAALETTDVIATPAEAQAYLSIHPTTQTAITGATNATYETAGLEEGVYEFVCRVTNANDAKQVATTPGFFVVVTHMSRRPYFTEQPEAAYGVVQGATATISCKAEVQSQEPLTYQWQASQNAAGPFSDLTGQTSATLSIPNINGDYNQWWFRCVVTNPASGLKAEGSACQIAVWNKADVPVVSNLQRKTAQDGTVQLVCTATVASGADLVPYVKVNDGPWGQRAADPESPNADGVWTYTITNPVDATYQVLWENANTSLLIANGGPYSMKPYAESNALVYGAGATRFIVVQPKDVSTAVGTTATFSVGATLAPVQTYPLAGNDKLVYVWQRSTDGGVTWKNCTASDGSGQFTSTFSVPVTQAVYDYAVAANMQTARNPYKFRVMVTDRIYGEYYYGSGTSMWSVQEYSKTVTLIPTTGSEVTPAITVKDGIEGLSVSTDETVGAILSGTALTVSKDGHKVSEVLDMLTWTPANSSYALRVVNAANEEKTADDIIGTGDIIQLIDTANDSAVLTKVTAIVRGDVMGTGKMSLTQLVRMAATLKTSDPTKLEGAYLLAGDLDGSGEISLTDLVQEAAMYRTQILDAGSEPAPTTEPTAEPTAEPSTAPTTEPTAEPTAEPSAQPTATATPAA